MLNYNIRNFNDLSKDELYDIMVLRQEVFIVEQNCAYLDADGKDKECYHIIGSNNNGNIHSYARLVPKGISYDEYNSIGRVITSNDYRGKGEGKKLMAYSIDQIQKLYPTEQTKISAQVYAIPFYNALGFMETGTRYDEDGIPHASMTL